MSKKKTPGAPPGRRPVTWVCVANINQAIVVKSIELQDSEPEGPPPGVFPKEDAEKIFMEMYGVEPEVVEGPFRKNKGMLSVKREKKITIDRDNIDNYTITLVAKKAKFGDWLGIAHVIEEDSSLFLFSPISHVDSSQNKKLIKGGIVSVNHLEFIR